MTEPPEPRHPEEGGREEDYEATWESADADEIMDGLEDDALLDSIAQGVRGELGPDALTKLLSELRDRPDDHDIPIPNTARVERGENVLPPRSKEGTPSMATSEDAARLRQLADSTEALAALQVTISQLSSIVDNVGAALGSGHSQLTNAIGPLQQCIEQASTLQGQIQTALSNLSSIAGTIG